MAIITEVRFAHEDGALAGTLGALPELAAGVVRETSTAPGQNAYFFRFDNVDPEVLPSTLEADHTVRAAEPVPAVDDRRLWRIEFASETKLLAPTVTKQGGFVLDAHSSTTRTVPRGWRERWFFPDPEGVHETWQHAQAAGFEFEVLDLSRKLRAGLDRVDSDPVTDEQRTALLTAYERGYFSEPRETSLEELAEALSLSPSAVHGRLKRGMKSLVGTTLVVETPGEAGSSPADREDAAGGVGDAGRTVRLRTGERDD